MAVSVMMFLGKRHGEGRHGAFLRRHASRVLGSISGFDCALIRGVLRSICYVQGLDWFMADRRRATLRLGRSMRIDANAAGFQPAPASPRLPAAGLLLAAASRPPSRGWGPGWLATPSLYESFVRDSLPVYPGAIQGYARPAPAPRLSRNGTKSFRMPPAPRGWLACSTTPMRR